MKILATAAAAASFVSMMTVGTLAAGPAQACDRFVGRGTNMQCADPPSDQVTPGDQVAGNDLNPVLIPGVGQPGPVQIPITPVIQPQPQKPSGPAGGTTLCPIRGSFGCG